MPLVLSSCKMPPWSKLALTMQTISFCHVFFFLGVLSNMTLQQPNNINFKILLRRNDPFKSVQGDFGTTLTKPNNIKWSMKVVP